MHLFSINEVEMTQIGAKVQLFELFGKIVGGISAFMRLD